MRYLLFITFLFLSNFVYAGDYITVSKRGYDSAGGYAKGGWGVVEIEDHDSYITIKGKKIKQNNYYLFDDGDEKHRRFYKIYKAETNEYDILVYRYRTAPRYISIDFQYKNSTRFISYKVLNEKQPGYDDVEVKTALRNQRINSEIQNSNLPPSSNDNNNINNINVNRIQSVNTNNIGLNGYNNGAFNNQSPVYNNPVPQQTKYKTCPSCKGSRTRAENRNISSPHFGSCNHKMVTCRECNFKYKECNTYHTHKTCTVCNGAGQVVDYSH